MKQVAAFLLTSVFIMGAWATPAQARYDDDIAKRICKQEMRKDYRAERFNHVTSFRKRPGVFKVEGTALRGSRRSGYFRCKVNSGRITQLSFDGWDRDGDGSKAGAVVAGVVIGAVIASVVSDDHQHDDQHDRGEDASDDTGPHYSPSTGIECYPRQQACYKDGHGYNARWTQREFSK